MLNLPISLESQINTLAEQAGKTVDLFLTTLITDYIEERQDIIEADLIYKRIIDGQETTISFEQLLKENGLDN